MRRSGHQALHGCHSWGEVPLVSPSGRIDGNCGTEPGDSLDPADYETPCATADLFCETQLVDGGYVDNSGLLTISLMWPELKRLIDIQNERTPDYPIAVVIVDIDSHARNDIAYRQPTPLVAEGSVPLDVASGARKAIEDAARGAVEQAHPVTCFVTIAPQVGPGPEAPLGWTLSQASKNRLRQALVTPSPSARGASANWPAYRLRRLQQWLDPDSVAPRSEYRFTPPLKACVPTV